MMGPWVMRPLDEVWNIHYRVAQDSEGAWFIVHPGSRFAEALKGQRFETREAAAEHLEYLLAVNSLEA